MSYDTVNPVWAESPCPVHQLGQHHLVILASLVERKRPECVRCGSVLWGVCTINEEAEIADLL